MSNLAFLAVAFVVSVVGTIVLLVRHHRPHTMEAAMREFEQRIRALAPQPYDEPGERRAG